MVRISLKLPWFVLISLSVKPKKGAREKLPLQNLGDRCPSFHKHVNLFHVQQITKARLLTVLKQIHVGSVKYDGKTCESLFGFTSDCLRNWCESFGAC